MLATKYDTIYSTYQPCNLTKFFVKTAQTPTQHQVLISQLSRQMQFDAVFPGDDITYRQTGIRHKY